MLQIQLDLALLLRGRHYSSKQKQCATLNAVVHATKHIHSVLVQTGQRHADNLRITLPIKHNILERNAVADRKGSIPVIVAVAVVQIAALLPLSSRPHALHHSTKTARCDSRCNSPSPYSRSAPRSTRWCAAAAPRSRRSASTCTAAAGTPSRGCHAAVAGAPRAPHRTSSGRDSTPHRQHRHSRGWWTR